MVRTGGDARVRVEKFRCAASGFEGWLARMPERREIPTPAIWKGRVYFGGGFGSYSFYALDAESGGLLWYLHSGDDGPTAAVVSDGYIAFNTESCTLLVVEAESGRTVWARRLGDPLLAQPAIGSHKVFAVFPSSGQHWLGAFDLHGGREVWRAPLSAEAITAVVYVKGEVFLATLDGLVWCLEAETGTKRWCEDFAATSAPWVHGNDVFVSRKSSASRGGKTRGKHPRSAPSEPLEQSAVLHKEYGRRQRAWHAKEAPYLGSKREWAGLGMWHEEDAKVGFGSPPPSAKLYTAEETVGEHLVSRVYRFQGSRPVVADGVLYQVTGEELEAIDVRTVQPLWNWRPEQNADPVERQLTPPAAARDRVWVGTLDGRVLSWDAAGNLRWQVKLLAPVHWQPAIAGGRVFVGLADGLLVSVSTGDLSDDGWPMWGGGPGHNGG